ncbi:MAG: hypothetical protein IT372_04860 [Polyangiaceae bacterium]|nr:hypothetical protein [Polyangiaceae bacterium]
MPAGGRGDGAARRTTVARDGADVLVSVPVPRGAPLAAPLRIDDFPCAGARLVVRLASAAAPCPACVDGRLAEACAPGAGLDAAGILDAVRAAVARCAELARADPAHVPGPPARPGARPQRSITPLRFAPPNAPHVDAGGAPTSGGDVDVILII